MKHLNAVITLFMVFGLLAVVPTQAQERVIVTDVPFDFAVGDRVLPSGSYRIAPIANSFQVLIDGEETKTAMFAAGFPRDGAIAGPSQLVFDKVGDRYFLRAVVSRSLTSVEFPKSKTEKRVQSLDRQLERSVTALVPAY